MLGSHRTCTHTHTCTHMHTHAHTCTHILTHTHKTTLTHTQNHTRTHTKPHSRTHKTTLTHCRGARVHVRGGVKQTSDFVSIAHFAGCRTVSSPGKTKTDRLQHACNGFFCCCCFRIVSIAHFADCRTVSSPGKIDRRNHNMYALVFCFVACVRIYETGATRINVHLRMHAHAH
jgi:hypothetical protein